MVEEGGGVGFPGVRKDKFLSGGTEVCSILNVDVSRGWWT